MSTMAKRGIIILSILVMSLTGCKSSDVQEVADQIKELNDMMNQDNNDFKNPENVVDYLKDKDSENEEPVEKIEDPGYVEINVSSGYDSKGESYAVKVDATQDEIVYSIIDLDEARLEGASVEFENDFYGKTADDIIDRMQVYYDGKDPKTGEIPLNDEELRKAIMQSAEGLLYVEYFRDSDKIDNLIELLEKMNYLIYESADIGSDDLVLSYNLAAVLAKASYDLEDFDLSEEALNQSEKLWQESEKVNDDSVSAEINRAWAASELFRATGAKTYRTIVEAISGDIDLRGVSFDEPGYFALFSYLSANESTSYDISNRMMKFFLGDINSRVKSTTDDLLKKSLKNLNGDEYECTLSEEFVNDIADEATLAMMANYITMSVEYTRYAQDRILFLLGANPTGNNYLYGDELFDMDSVIFAVDTLRVK